MDYLRYYEAWLLGRRTLTEIADHIGISVRTLRARFDDLLPVLWVKPPPEGAVNLVIDATFFGGSFGYMCFHDTSRVVHFREIRTESLMDLEAGLDVLTKAGYRFKSFTIDGRRGVTSALQRRFPGVPIQMCQFHQQAIVRRYITNNPKTPCGQDLKALMKRFGREEPQHWIDSLFVLQNQYAAFLAEKSNNGQYTHRRLRSAFHSLQTNLPHLFLCHEIPEANIPNTTNHLEGTFAHLKEKITLHRGLREHRKKKAIEFFLHKT